MTVRTRAVLGELPSYRPGRTPERVARERGVAAPVKLSSNETVFDPLPGVAEAMAAAVTSPNRYPDFHATALREAVAQTYGVEPEQVVTGCGSVALCRNVVEATAEPGGEVIVPTPSFDVYGSAARIAGATPVRVPLREHALDLDAMAAAVTDDTQAIFVCTPNNPTSTAVARAELERFLDRVPATVPVVLDEAYHHFVTDPSGVDGMRLLARRPNLVVLRTFSKAYGLAGLRVGFGVAAPELAAALRKVTLPFSVSSVGGAAAVASLQPAAATAMAARVARVVAERERVSKELAGLGYEVPASQANFVWLPIGERSADFGAESERRGVIVRSFAGAGVRVTIGAPEENDAFLRIAAELA
ncbi:histidinol-phosphate transaminase [Pseudonocardia acaciae]|uniref:histidinol-phosphate transaminase n=1 Tax=Pseudonocardia acaciae TaxID=551276 RepID=UPI00048CEA5A|nr:histidinol-phosphate transaminase [Pseudonocardia acaciae]